jgi:mRNA interferase MazF
MVLADNSPLRGDVWLLDLGNPVGHEAGLKRPAMIVSADEFNSHGLVTVLPITRTDKPYPTRIAIQPGLSGLHERSFIQVEHIRTVSSARLTRRLGIGSSEMPRVETILRHLLKLA